jgi:ubiquinone/menaquinone biosynthesis C-methylase UbiE
VGVYADQILPRITDLALRGEPIDQLRQQATAGLDGEVLEVGFGSGRNVPYYPQLVDRVRAVDPATVGRKLAAERVAASGVPIEYVGLDGAQLPLDDASVDHVLTTWTLCTIPDVERALAEMRRVLRPGGALHFVEHGRAPDAGVARWQERLNPLQRKVFGGCHLNRRIDELICGAGLDVTRLENHYLKGPKPFGYMYVGIASKAR